MGDVLEKYHYSGSISAATGRCGRELGSNGYLEHMERKAFDNALDNAGGTSYR